MFVRKVGFKSHKVNETLVVFALVLIITVSLLIDIAVRMYINAESVYTFSDVKDKTIVLDAGHGGEDCGAIGKNGVYEKDLNLEITMLIGELLSGYGYNVVYTRTEDKLLYRPEENVKGIRKISDLKNRCEIARMYDNAVFISIHMNSFGDAKYSGLQVYYSEENSGSRILAENIQSSVRDTLQQNNKRKIKVGKGIYLLENLDIPAILIECGFLSNYEECEKLSEKEYQKQLCFSIVCGIIEYVDTRFN